MTWPIEGGELG